MSKMCSHDPFGHLNTSYGQKKGHESNWQFDFRSLKVRNHHNFLACKWRTTYRWKALDKGYNFAWDLIPIRGFHVKLWAPKVARNPTVGILGLPLGSLEVFSMALRSPWWALHSLQWALCSLEVYQGDPLFLKVHEHFLAIFFLVFRWWRWVGPWI
jgi:hypothetical protein